MSKELNLNTSSNTTSKQPCGGEHLPHKNKTGEYCFACVCAMAKNKCVERGEFWRWGVEDEIASKYTK